jgi:MFS family permease
LTLGPGAPGAGPQANSAVVVTALGLTQILAWGSSYYLPAVLAAPIAADTGWSLTWVVGGLSIGLGVAGLSSPYVGRAIQAAGGRNVLASSALLLALGQIGVALSINLIAYLAAWIIIGIGMGAGLYDAAFATLGRLYLGNARRLIAALTLFGGLASTVCWPLSAFLLEHFGWRGACLVYAGIQILFALPLYLFVLPGRGALPPVVAPFGESERRASRYIAATHRLRFLLLAAAVALAAVISTVVSVHLLTFLQATDITLAAAVTLGAMVGPAQVSARAIDIAFGRHYHPIWTMLAGTLLVTAGVGLLFVGFPILSIGLLLYGGGIGIESIARGTVPLAIFDPNGYAAIMGSIAMPSLIAQAIAPWLGAILIEHGGSELALGVLVAAATVNVALVAILFALCRRPAVAGS